MSVKCATWIVGLICLPAAAAHGSVIITEIMYNPVGGGDGVVPPALSSEWVELYNSGAQPVDLGGWRLDDEDATDWGQIPAGSVLLPGEVAVLAATDDEFKQTWGAGIKVLKVVWGQLANSGSATNEVLVLLNGSDVEMDRVNYETSANGWPASPNGSSIYLVDPAADNNIGTNWAVSVAGVDGAYSPSTYVLPYGATTGAPDTGSPGFVVPEPAGLLLLGVSLVLLCRRVR